MSTDSASISAPSWRARPHGFDQGGGFLIPAARTRCLSSVKLIAEPWDFGPGGYQVGGFPAGLGRVERPLSRHRAALLEGRRRQARRFRGAHQQAPAICSIGAGRKPWASVNFITAHDGFTLNDLVSYNDKHNEANGEENRDGHSDNHSWNYGAEGPTDDPEIVELRERQKRNFLGTLLFSQGTPMILAGDEFGRTQRGNNNAYCQDNEISWVDWITTTAAEALIAFVERLTSLRRRLSGSAAEPVS